ncbi:hypothetical protein RFN28_00845 [Mesorhizobium sp. VK24D]|uniref:Uncharacterized protein n=1 Tax=Mesorhizobium album TaxID=3072314 RepID=A0ABU4XR02_9HYPH|nr:hypothetical protein [Mesorhizobium sp. VK24D]MDX8477018.1 hypothetical protein [Mesorhizobium sp. VK24D]
MGQLSIFHYLVMLVLVALLLALAVLTIVKRDAFRKVIVGIAIVSAGPLSFEAVNLVAKLLPAGQPVSDAGAAYAPTDVSTPASAETVPVVDQPPPVKPVQPHPSNPDAKFAQYSAPGCQLPGDVDKFNHLYSANRLDLALKLDCIIIPKDTEVILLDTLGDLGQFIWEKDGTTIEFWARAGNFRYNFTRMKN